MRLADEIQALFEEAMREVDRLSLTEVKAAAFGVGHWLAGLWPRMPCEGWQDELDWMLNEFARNQLFITDQSRADIIAWVTAANEEAKRDALVPGGAGPRLVDICYGPRPQPAALKSPYDKPAPIDPGYPELRRLGHVIMEQFPPADYQGGGKPVVRLRAAFLDKRPPAAYHRALPGWGKRHGLQNSTRGEHVNLDYLALLFRWLHILAAITVVGGAAFARFALLPATAALGPQQRVALLEAVRMRWSKVVAGGIAILLISGLFNIARMERVYALGSTYHMLFGIKFILALLIFALASLLSGRSRSAQKLRENASFWLSVNLLMAVVLVCISGALKDLPHTPKPGEPATAIGMLETGRR